MFDLHLACAQGQHEDVIVYAQDLEILTDLIPGVSLSGLA
jgi:hypothetical protein